MFDETNQAEEIMEAEEDLFDEGEDNAPETEDESAGDEAKPSFEPSDNKGGEEEKHTIRYNGEDISLSLDELKTNAQKGLNYDKIYERYNELKNSPTISILERYAKKSGMSLDEYTNYLKELETQQQVSNMESKGIPEEAARRIIELEEKESIRAERDAENEKKEAERKEFNDFIKRYPDVRASEIPDEVWQRQKEGMSLSAAYALYENRILKTKVKQLEQNEINSKKAVGSVKGESSGDESDAFLEGLFG